MSGNGISIGGLASGLDSQKIIAQLVQLEELPITALQNKKKVEQSKLTTLGTFQGYVKDLQSQAKALSTKADFLVFTVTPSQTGVAGFSATGSAAAGSHTLTVDKLAAIDRWAFDGVASPSTDLASVDGQTVSFSVGAHNYSVSLQQSASSLTDIAVAINTAAGADASASVVNAGTTSSPSYQLVLTSNKSGKDARITNVASTVAGLTIDGSGPDANGVAQSTNNITVGNNAVAVIDGLSVERETNDFNDVLSGVSIATESADPAKTIHFSIEADDKSIKAKVQSFVDAYNKVATFINDQNTYSKDAGPGGDLFGDSILQSVRQSVDGALFGIDPAIVSNDTQGFSTLGLIGIKKASDGTLSIDSTTFDAKLAANVNSVANLFVDTDGFDNGGAAPNTPGYYTDTTADSGIAASLDRSIERMFATYTGPGGQTFKGVFDNKTATIDASIKRFDDQISSKQFYLEQFQQGLIDKFAKLEQVIGGLNAQGAALTAAIANLK